MATSLITRKRIAQAFIQILQEKEFEKISVSNIMERAGIRRQTFYNYFLDKYDLVEWIFKNDVSEQVTDNLEFISGLQLLKELSYFFETNRYFYQQLFNMNVQNDINQYFIEYCRQIILKIINEYTDTSKLSIKDDDLFISYHSHALADTFKDFILNKNSEPIDSQRLIRLIQVSVENY